MGDWVHCNHCFHQPGDGRGFFLTSCGHIYCEQCRKKATENKCEMCSAKCTTLPLTSKMKPEVDIFFTDPCEIARKHTKELNQVIEFQKNHRLRLMAYNKKKMNVHIKQQKDLEREIVVVKEKNSYYERLIQNQGGGVVNIRVSPQQRPNSAISRNSPLGMQHGQSQGYVSQPSVTPQQLQQMTASRRKTQGTPGSSTPNDYKSPPPNQQDSSISSSQNSIRAHTPNGTRITSNRMISRTPPAHGKMGTIPGSTPSPLTSPQNDETPKVGLSAVSVGAYGDGGKMEVSPSGALTSGVQNRVPSSAGNFPTPRSSQDLGLGLLQQQRNPPRPMQISSMTSPPDRGHSSGPVLVVPSPGGKSYREYPLSGLTAGHFKSPPP